MPIPPISYFVFSYFQVMPWASNNLRLNKQLKLKSKQSSNKNPQKKYFNKVNINEEELNGPTS